MRSIVYAALKSLAPLMTVTAGRRGAEAIVMFLCALMGKGGGSSWNIRGQLDAIVKSTVPRDGITVIDVGANNGAWSSLLFERFADFRPVFHLFECAPYCFSEIEKRTKHMNAVTVNHDAVSDSNGSAILHLPTVGSGLASIHRRQDTSVKGHTYREISVKTVTIDSYIARSAIDHVDILKIDVEGHELSVLRGAEESIKAGLINIIIFEFGSANINSRTFFIDFWHFFTSAGYKIKRIIPNGSCIDVEKYDDTLEYFRGCSNYIATRV